FWCFPGRAFALPEMYGARAPEPFLLPRIKRERSAERRRKPSTPCRHCPRVAALFARLARAPQAAERTPLDASQRRFCTPGPFFLHTGGSLFASLSRSFRFARPAQSSHRRQPLVVGADGDPGRPGREVTNSARRRRIPLRHRLRLATTPSRRTGRAQE